jgi:hypothetical protein
MASRKRTPRTAGARGSSKGRKKSRAHTRKPKRRQPFAPRTQCWRYDGQRLIGTLITKYDGTTVAFDGARRALGVFPTRRAGAAAIDTADMTVVVPA